MKITKLHINKYGPIQNDLRLAFSKALDMPWVAWGEVFRLFAYPYIRALFALHGIRCGKGWRVWGMPVIQRYRGSQITLGDGLWLRSWRRSNPVLPHNPVVLATRSSSAKIWVGVDVGLTGTILVANEQIHLGDRVLIGSNSIIVDTDFHPLNPLARCSTINSGLSLPVEIEDDVFIGMNCLILKGVRIGRGSVVGAGSVVTREIPRGVVAAGNPARVLRNI
jgi:hypothetical protein